MDGVILKNTSYSINKRCELSGFLNLITNFVDVNLASWWCKINFCLLSLERILRIRTFFIHFSVALCINTFNILLKCYDSASRLFPPRISILLTPRKPPPNPFLFLTTTHTIFILQCVIGSFDKSIYHHHLYYFRPLSPKVIITHTPTHCGLVGLTKKQQWWVIDLVSKWKSKINQFRGLSYSPTHLHKTLWLVRFRNSVFVGGWCGIVEKMDP